MKNLCIVLLGASLFAPTPSVGAAEQPAAAPPKPAAETAAVAAPTPTIPAAAPQAAAADAQKPKPKPAKRPPPEPVVMARVGDTDITVEEFMQFITISPQYIRLAESQLGKVKILRAMISDRLLHLAMADEGLLPKDGSETGDDYIKAYQELAEKHFPVGKVPTDEELYAYYQAHQDQFGIAESVHVKQIQLRVPADATPEQDRAIRAKAESLLKRLEQGESFDELAGEYTENPRAKAAKGDVGFLTRNTDPWLKSALEGIGPGQHTGVLKSKAGYEILLLVETRDAVVMPYANVRKKVLEKYYFSRLQQVRDKYLAKIAKQYGVEILMPGLEAANPALYGGQQSEDKDK